MTKNKIFDYQSICTIDTPKEERKKLGIGDIYSNSGICNHCKDEIRSMNKHHYAECKCGKFFIDGGSWYIRSNDQGVSIPILFKDVEK